MEKIQLSFKNDINTPNDSDTPNGDISINNDAIEKFFQNTIDKHFKDEAYQLLKNQENVIEHFYINEKSCLEYIKNNYKENRKIYKNLFYESLLEIFKKKEQISKISGNIIDTINKLNKKFFSDEINISLSLYNSKLKEKFNTNDIPHFLIYQTKRRIKNIIFVREYENNLDNKLEKDNNIKNVIYFYQWISYSREKGMPLQTYSKNYFEIPEYTTVFDDILNNSNLNDNLNVKKILFRIFILSNSQVLLYNEYTKKVFIKNYERILSWFDLNLNDQNNTYESVYNSFISLPLVNVKDFIKLNINLLEDIINSNEQYFFIIASFFYCITKEIIDVNIYPYKEKFKFNYLLDNTIHNLQTYLKSIKFDIKLIIAYLDYYQIKENYEVIKINEYYKFKDIEEIFKDQNLPKHMIQRFDILINKIKECYQSNFNLIPMLFSKLINIFSSKIDDLSREKLEFIPYSKKYYSSEITLLISGFGAESDNHSESWKNLIISIRRSMFYFFQWPGDSFDKIIIKSLPKKLNLVNGIPIFDSAIPNVFLSAKRRAKYSGKLLGLILATKKIFGNCQINLIGFSLGAHVIKNCLKELYRLKIDNNIINNVMFIAGATHIEQMFWSDIFNEVVNGRIINCYSKNDSVLKRLFEPCVEKKPIGWDKLIIGQENSIKIENYDMTDLKLKHTDYREHFEEVLKKVNL